MPKVNVTTSAVDREHLVRDATGEVHELAKDTQGRALYWARRPFGYAGEDFDRGQVFAVRGQVNDSKLVRLGYMMPLAPTDRTFPCRECGGQFVDESSLNAHGHKRHENRSTQPNVPLGPGGVTVDETAVESQKLETEQAQMEKIAPLNLDKTEANRT